MKKVLHFLSPCLLSAFFCLFAISLGYIQMESSGGWSYLAVIIFLPVLITVVVIDIIARWVFKKKTLYLWLTEIVLLIAVYFILIHKYV